MATANDPVAAARAAAEAAAAAQAAAAAAAAAAAQAAADEAAATQVAARDAAARPSTTQALAADETRRILEDTGAEGAGGTQLPDEQASVVAGRDLGNMLDGGPRESLLDLPELSNSTVAGHGGIAMPNVLDSFSASGGAIGKSAIMDAGSPNPSPLDPILTGESDDADTGTRPEGSVSKDPWFDGWVKGYIAGGNAPTYPEDDADADSDSDSDSDSGSDTTSLFDYSPLGAAINLGEAVFEAVADALETDDTAEDTSGDTAPPSSGGGSGYITDTTADLEGFSPPPEWYDSDLLPGRQNSDAILSGATGRHGGDDSGGRTGPQGGSTTGNPGPESSGSSPGRDGSITSVETATSWVGQPDSDPLDPALQPVGGLEVVEPGADPNTVNPGTGEAADAGTDASTRYSPAAAGSDAEGGSASDVSRAASDMSGAAADLASEPDAWSYAADDLGDDGPGRGHGRDKDSDHGGGHGNSGHSGDGGGRDNEEDGAP